MQRTIIEGINAHFGYGMESKTVKTYEIPNPSTVVGIIENLYDLDKCNSEFKFGYFIEFSGKHEDFMSIEKITEKKGILRDNVYYEFLNDVKLVIYTDIDKELVIREVLKLGSAKCLGTVTSHEEVELIDHEGYIYNQLAKVGCGDGRIRTCNTLTYFDNSKDCFDYIVKPLQECREVESSENYDSDLDVCINIFHYKNGKIF